MTKELKEHIEARYSECCKRSQGLSYGSFYDGYVDCYCEQQKQIEKLEQQIEGMKCCENCIHHYIALDDTTSCKLLDRLASSKPCEKWEIKEK